MSGATGRRGRVSPWPFIGVGGLACLLFIDLASATFLPWWVVVALAVLWVVLFGLACAWFARRPSWVPVLPVLGLLVWVGVVVAAARGWL